MSSHVAEATPSPPVRRNRLRAAPSPWALAYTVSDAQSMGAPGKTKLYELKKSGQLRFIKSAGRTMICGDSLRKLLGVTEP